VNLTEWEHARGINGTAACRWCQEGTRPVPARTASRLILVSPRRPPPRPGSTGQACMCGCPVMTRGRACTGRSPGCRRGAVRAGLPVAWVAAEVGSPMNGVRAGARRLLAGPAAAWSRWGTATGRKG
jgi:putative resolvase